MPSRSINQPSESRTALAQDVEFVRFLNERLADSQRDADRCQSDIETLMAQVEAKRREQGEHLNIADACRAGIQIADRSLRPAPQLTPRSAEPTALEAEVQS